MEHETEVRDFGCVEFDRLVVFGGVEEGVQAGDIACIKDDGAIEGTRLIEPVLEVGRREEGNFVGGDVGEIDGTREGVATELDCAVRVNALEEACTPCVGDVLSCGAPCVIALDADGVFTGFFVFMALATSGQFSSSIDICGSFIAPKDFVFERAGDGGQRDGLTIIGGFDNGFEDAGSAAAVSTADFAFTEAVAVLDAFFGANETASGIAEAVFAAVFVCHTGFTFVAFATAVDSEFAVILDTVFASIRSTAVFCFSVADHTGIADGLDDFEFTGDAFDDALGVGAAEDTGLGATFLAFTFFAFEAFGADFGAGGFAGFADHDAGAIDASIRGFGASGDAFVFAGIASFTVIGASGENGDFACFTGFDEAVFSAGDAVICAELNAFTGVDGAFVCIANPTGSAVFFDGSHAGFADNADRFRFTGDFGVFAGGDADASVAEEAFSACFGTGSFTGDAGVARIFAFEAFHEVFGTSVDAFAVGASFTFFASFLFGGVSGNADELFDTSACDAVFDAVADAFAVGANFVIFAGGHDGNFACFAVDNDVTFTADAGGIFADADGTFGGITVFGDGAIAFAGFILPMTATADLGDVLVSALFGAFFAFVLGFTFTGIFIADEAGGAR